MRNLAHVTSRRLLALLLSAPLLASEVQAFTPGDVYTSVCVVTGQGPENRTKGFADCLDKVLPRVSGNSRLADGPVLQAAREHAAEYIEEFSYHDRLAGRPVHDEQGTHDRPFDLTCRFRKQRIDDLLDKLGTRPWLAKRPILEIVLDVRRGDTSYRVTAEASRDLAMRQSFAVASDLSGIDVVFPSEGNFSAGSTTGATPLRGELDWNETALGWVATWTLNDRHNGVTPHDVTWQVQGVGFDDAFRAALRGAAQILSGNGEPIGTLATVRK
ncbi:DUF2066 domain-containing protein [Rhizobium lusitanum]|uniref:DUF2066 domain-containing protein n=1 Tax=Rhizobium lusitanum TaxID=293958 RepID=A0A7X0IRA6_9HYPH|nr:DUF2066 domain-containing protein [Rhizobium lusitanum]MBB6484231.1 hypothetical protein [Rhizobium lusitanum]